jgi:hypothetical protein
MADKTVLPRFFAKEGRKLLRLRVYLRAPCLSAPTDLYCPAVSGKKV